jgi:hypothetical protein
MAGWASHWMFDDEPTLEFMKLMLSWPFSRNMTFLEGPVVTESFYREILQFTKMEHCDHLYILCVPIMRLLATPWAVPESFLNWDSISWLTSVLFFMSGSKTSLLLGIPDVKAWSEVVYLYCAIEISNEVHEIGTGWSGEIRSITFAADSSTVSVVYRVTIRGSDGEVLLPVYVCCVI